jgi:GntR family transcriptional regulator
MKPSISIDERSKEPIYQQIMQGVRHLVATGQLVAGDELPSLRQLAVDLNVHLNTVALAYRELERQGIVRLRQGSRATILPVDRASLAPDPQARERLRDGLVRLRTEAILAGFDLAELRRLAEEVLGD